MIPLRTTKRSTASAPGDRYIKCLLDAEKRGNAKITEAQARRVILIKKARTEAEVEVNAFRKQKEEKIQEKLRQIEHDVELEKILDDRRVDATIKEYEKRVSEVKEKVIANILNLVADIKPEVHRNFTLRKTHE